MRKQKRHCQSSLTFENLWQEWLDTELFITGKSRKMEGMGYEEIFKSLPADEQKALLRELRPLWKEIIYLRPLEGM